MTRVTLLGILTAFTLSSTACSEETRATSATTTIASAVPLGFAPAQNLNTSYAGSDNEFDWEAEIAIRATGSGICLWRSGMLPGMANRSGTYILASATKDFGRTWSGANAVNPEVDQELVTDSTIHVALGMNGRWLAAWQSNEPYSGGHEFGQEYDIVFTYSDDDGLTWTMPRPLNSLAWIDDPRFAQDHGVRLAAGPSGTVVAVWYSDAKPDGSLSPDREIYFTRSTDNGTTFGAQTPLNTNFATDFGLDAQPNIATDGSGRWVAAWASDDARTTNTPSDFDILYATSGDDGVSWSAPRLLNSNGDTDQGGDGITAVYAFFDKGPQVATDKNGLWITVWHSDDSFGGTLGTDTDIMLARSTDGGETWSAPAPVNNDAAADNPNTPTARYDSGPRIVYDGIGNWIVTWVRGVVHSEDSYETSVAIARSTDGGLTWSDPAFVNSNSDVTASYDFAPTIATDGKGHWAAAWSTTDPAFGGGGQSLFAETDIAYTYSCNLDPPAQGDIVDHLVGKLSPTPEKLDANCDGKIDAADVVKSGQ